MPDEVRGPNVRLAVRGREYRGWTSVRVTRGLEAIAGSFELAVSERWYGQAEPWPIIEGDPCTVAIGDEVPLTGLVDTRRLEYGADMHAIAIGGRDATGQLVDCSAVLDTWEFGGLSLDRLARRLAEPFGVPVTMQPGLTLLAPIARQAVNPGDSVFEVLDRACKLAGVLPVADGRGGLLLTRAGSTRADTAIVEGENILRASVEYDATSRYARYRVTGQRGGTDHEYGAAVADVSGDALDTNVRAAARVLLIRAEGDVTPAYARRRAEWEATVRAARAQQVSVTVHGWQQRSGALWPINALVAVRSPRIGIDGELLITEATYTLSDADGTITALTLMPPGAFTPEPIVPTDGRWRELDGLAPVASH